MTDNSPNLPRWSWLSVAIAALLAFELAHIFIGHATLRYLAWTSGLAFVVFAMPRTGLRERALVGICAAMAVWLVLRHQGEVLARAVDQAVFLASFIQILGLLREAAITSQAIRACGLHLTRQPPQRRYLAIHAGSHLFGMILNFGAISLLAPLIQEGVKASDGDERVRAIRERRQLSAMIRGFSWIVVWAPSSVTQALLISLFPGADHVRAVTLGVVTAAVMMVLGWLEDRFRYRRTAPRPPVAVSALAPRTLHHLAGIVAMLLALVFIIRLSSNVGIVPSLMLAAPIALSIWVFVQNGALGPARGLLAVGQRWRHVVLVGLPAGVREGVMLGASGFIGVVAGALTPADEIAALLGRNQIDPALFLMALPILIILAGQIALSPVMMVVFLGSVISAFPTPPADHALVAFALASGWGLTMTAAPNATGSLMLSRITGIPSTVLTWRWNGPFTLLALGWLAIVFVVLTRS
ncbi:MAG: hypothetical protein KDG54_10545 [Geminicoccaceae bacterium]|nr:hypothetical protein [Geminicoccaceae bacterium]